MKHRILPIALAALFLTGPPKAISAPPLINYQGRIAVGTPAVNFNGTGQFKFALVDATGNVTFWSNDGSSVGGSQPAASVPLTVTKGLYSVLLGDTSLMNPLVGPAIFSQPDLRLRVWFSDNTPTGFQLLSPDQRLAPTAYLADGAVSSTSLADGAITTAKIATGAVTGTQIAPYTLDFNHLGVPASPTPGQVLGFNGGSLAWTAPGNGAFSLNGTNAYYNGGNVGIGTASPSWLLDVNGSMHVGSPFANGTPKLIRFGDGDYVSIGENNQDDRMELTASTFAFKNGNVGVGTVTPDFKLVVTDAGVAQLGFSPTYGIRSGYLGNGTEYDGGDLQLQGGWNIYNGGRIRLGGDGRGDADRNVIQFLQNTVERMRIHNNGNVGIGSSDPVGRLEIVGQDALRLIGYQPFLTLYDSAAGYAGTRIQSVGGALNFFTGSYIPGNNRFARLDDNGNFTVRTLTIRGGADLAEPFQMKEEELEKGSVVVIDDEHPGRLKRSGTAYDTRVAGIISGANGVNPGIALHQEGVMEGGQNVALSGRVYVQADASSAPIKPGDLLTTSALPGHAMKVTDHAKAQGAVIGKAMSSLSEGTGMVLVLVTLQ